MGRSSLHHLRFRPAGSDDCRFVVSVGLAAIALLMLCSHVAGETWAERLGYPPGKRVLILYCAQMGMCHEANQAGESYLSSGLAQSAGAMPPCPWFDDFARWSRKHPDADVGLALTLNSEWKHYRWRPVSARTEVPGLVDSRGYLARSVLQVMFNATAEEAEREILAQIHQARSAGIEPGHLSPHLGTLFSRPDLIAVYLEAARKEWIPALVIELTPDLIQRFQSGGFPVDDRTIELIANYPLPKIDDLRFMPPGESYEVKRDRFFDLVRSLSPGITQIVLQPAVESAALVRIADDWQQRVWDGQILADPEVLTFLKEEQIVFTSWKEMMRRFEGEREPSAREQ